MYMQQNFDARQLKKLAQSPIGQKLMQAVNESGNTDARKAAELASAGNMEAAKQTLSALLTDPQIQALLKQLEGQL